MMRFLIFVSQNASILASVLEVVTGENLAKDIPRHKRNSSGHIEYAKIPDR